MVVKINNEGSPFNYAISNINNITFANGNMNIATNTGKEGVAISTIQNLTFSTATGIKTPENQPNNFLLYPIPVNDILYIMYTSAQGGQLQLEIVSLDGKVISSQMLYSQKGQNNNQINISSLAQGLYIIRLNDFTTTTISKFLKN